jgi:hypothetical protein
MEDKPLSMIKNCFSNIYVASLHVTYDISLLYSNRGKRLALVTRDLQKRGFIAKFCNSSSFVGVITFPLAIQNFLILPQEASSVKEQTGKTVLKVKSEPVRSEVSKVQQGLVTVSCFSLFYFYILQTFAGWMGVTVG